MVSGFLISPKDQLRIFSGLAMPIRISSNVSAFAGMTGGADVAVHPSNHRVTIA